MNCKIWRNLVAVIQDRGSSRDKVSELLGEWVAEYRDIIVISLQEAGHTAAEIRDFCNDNVVDGDDDGTASSGAGAGAGAAGAAAGGQHVIHPGKTTRAAKRRRK